MSCASAAFLRLRAARASGGSRRFHGGMPENTRCGFCPAPGAAFLALAPLRERREESAVSRGDAGKREVRLLSRASAAFLRLCVVRASGGSRRFHGAMPENTRCGFCPAPGVAFLAPAPPRERREEAGGFTGQCRKTRGAAFVPRQRCVPSFARRESVGRKLVVSRGGAGKSAAWAAKRPRDAGTFA